MARPLFLDVSQHQGDTPLPDYVKVADAGYVGVIARAVDSNQRVDPELLDNLSRARGTGRLWTGAYHNLIRASVTQQFGTFQRAVPEWRGVIPMVDSEQGASFAQLEQFMGIAAVEFGRTRAGKIKCLVYLPRWYWVTLTDRKPLPEDWVWVHSRYDVEPGPLIPPLTSLEGHVWQFTNKGQVPGITENTVDLNRYYGDEATLLQLAVQ